MAFAPSLAGSGTGQSGLNFPQSSSADPMSLISSIIPIVSQMRNQSVANREQEAAYNSNLSLQNDITRQRLAKIAQTDQQPNVVFQDNHPDITPAQGAELGVRKAGQDIQSAELKNKLQDTGFQQNLETKKLDLETLKNKQIFDTKQADMQRKVDEANQKLDLAYTNAQRQAGNVAATQAYHQAQLEAIKAQHDLDNTRHDNQLAETKRMHDAQMADMQRKLDLASGSTTVTETSDYDSNNNPTKKTTTTTKGKSKNRVNVTGPNGETGTVEEGDDLPTGWSLAGQSDGGGE